MFVLGLVLRTDLRMGVHIHVYYENSFEMCICFDGV